MEDGLKWFRLLDDYSDIKSYCVVAGGDGTIGNSLIFSSKLGNLSLSKGMLSL